MDGLRTFQPFGGVRMVDENILVEDLEMQDFPGLEPEYNVWQWRQSETDYVVMAVEYGHEIVRKRLTGYSPSFAMKAIFDNVDFDSS